MRLSAAHELLIRLFFAPAFGCLNHKYVPLSASLTLLAGVLDSVPAHQRG